MVGAVGASGGAGPFQFSLSPMLTTPARLRLIRWWRRHRQCRLSAVVSPSGCGMVVEGRSAARHAAAGEAAVLVAGAYGAGQRGGDAVPPGVVLMIRWGWPATRTRSGRCGRPGARRWSTAAAAVDGGADPGGRQDHRHRGFHHRLLVEQVPTASARRWARVRWSSGTVLVRARVSRAVNSASATSVGR